MSRLDLLAAAAIAFTFEISPQVLEQIGSLAQRLVLREIKGAIGQWGGLHFDLSTLAASEANLATGYSEIFVQGGKKFSRRSCKRHDSSFHSFLLRCFYYSL